jgi:hypothetical protein
MAERGGDERRLLRCVALGKSRCRRSASIPPCIAGAHVVPSFFQGRLD